MLSRSSKNFPLNLDQKTALIIILSSDQLQSIEVRGWHIEQEPYGRKEKVWSEEGVHVSEDMLRSRSKCLVSRIDRARNQGNEKIVIELSGSDQTVEKWTDWIVGEPMYGWADDELHDDVLFETVEVYVLARECKDYDCVNACLDTIRLLLCHSNDLYNPIRVLEPVLKLVDDEGDKPSEMIMDLLVYGPCAELGRTEKWIETLKQSSFDGKKRTRWRRFFKMYRRMCKQKSEKASQDTGIVPDSMAPDAYHLSEPEDHANCHSLSGESDSDIDFIG